MVDLLHEVSVRADTARTLEFLGWHDRCVRGVQRHIGEERLGRVGLTLRLDEGDRLVDDRGHHVDRLELRTSRAGAQPSLSGARNLRHAAILDPDERRHVQRRADPVERVKAVIDRTVHDVATVVHRGRILEGLAEVTAVVGDTAVLQRETHAKMPLPKTTRRIALLLEQAGERQTVLRDQRGRETAEHTGLEFGAPVVTTGQQAVAGRRADAGGRMSVGEPHSAFGQRIQVRGGNLAQRIVGAEVAEALVVGQDDDDVGPVGGDQGQGHQPTAKQGKAHGELTPS